MLHWWKDSYLQAWKNIQSERGAGEKHLQGRLVRPVATAVLARTIILTCDVGMAPWRFAATTLSVFTFSRWLWWGRCVRCETATVWDSFFLLAEVRLFKIKPLSLSFFASFLKCPTESGSEGSDKNLSNRERIRKKKRVVHVHGRSALWTKDAPPNKYHYPGITLRLEIWHEQLSSPSVPGHSSFSSLSFYFRYLLIIGY